MGAAPFQGGLGDRHRRRRHFGKDTFALRLTYFVTWGPNARFGRAAGKAGLRNNDVLLAAAGKSDFKSGDHFQAWYRITRKAGDTVLLKILRGPKQLTLTLPVIE